MCRFGLREQHRPPCAVLIVLFAPFITGCLDVYGRGSRLFAVHCNEPSRSCDRPRGARCTALVDRIALTGTSCHSRARLRRFAPADILAAARLLLIEMILTADGK